MRYTLLLLVLLFAFKLSFSQQNDSIVVLQSSSGRLSGLIDIQDLVNEGFNYWEDEFEGHWSGIELGMNGFANSDYSLYPQDEKGFLSNDLLRSNLLKMNLIQYSRSLQSTRNTIGLVTGLGLSLQSYRLNSNTSLLLDENKRVHPDNLIYAPNQKSKLSIVYIEVPLLVEFQIPINSNKNRLYCSAGINFGKRLAAHTKVKYKIANKYEKVKSTGTYSLRDFKFAGTARIGYRRFNLFASYDLTPMFNDRRGPKLYPFSVGLRLVSF